MDNRCLMKRKISELLFRLFILRDGHRTLLAGSCGWRSRRPCAPDTSIAARISGAAKEASGRITTPTLACGTSGRSVASRARSAATRG
jgi:hypothetical protein